MATTSTAPTTYKSPLLVESPLYLPHPHRTQLKYHREPIQHSMDQFPVLRNLLSNNTKWAAAVSAADPNFFTCNAANPQRPKVSHLMCTGGFNDVVLISI